MSTPGPVASPRTPPPARAGVGEDADPGQLFTGARQPLRHLATVKPGTVAVLWPPSGPPEIRRPPDLLVPGRPFAPPRMVMPVTTDPVGLVVSLTDLVTLDGHPVSEVEVQLRVQLDPDDPGTAALELAVEHGGGLGAELMQQVLRATDTAVRAAVRMNRLADLRRMGLAAVLQHRWLPVAYAGGRVRRLDVTVPRVEWPEPASTSETRSDLALRPAPGAE
ncbi:MAG: hypothetical protein ACLGIF_08570 [Actinomycetes bacterium]